MAKISDLPPELITLILHHDAPPTGHSQRDDLYHIASETERARRSFLLTTSLISRLFTRPSQETLWALLICWGSKDCERILMSPSLGMFPTRSAVFFDEGMQWQEGDEFRVEDAIHISDLECVLHRLKGLRDLTFNDVVGIDHAVFNCPALADLQVVTFRYLYREEGQKPAVLGPATPSLPRHLRRLDLVVTPGPAGTSLAIDLIKASSSTLTTLGLSVESGSGAYPQLLELFPTIAPNLTCLIYDRADLEGLNLLPFCTRLEYLVICSKTKEICDQLVEVVGKSLVWLTVVLRHPEFCRLIKLPEEVTTRRDNLGPEELEVECRKVTARMRDLLD